MSYQPAHVSQPAGSPRGQVVKANTTARSVWSFPRVRRCPAGSSEQPLKPTSEDEVLQCLNLVYILLKQLLEGLVTAVPFSSVTIALQILGMFFSKADLLRGNKVRTRSVASSVAEESLELLAHSSLL